MYITAIFLFTELAAAQSSAPAMLTDYWQGQKKAQKESRPLAVFLGSGAQGFQKVVKDARWSAEIDQVLAKHYVCVYLDVSTAAAKKLATAFEISSGKGLVISDRTGAVQAYHHDGDLAAAELAATLSRHAQAGNVKTTETSNSTRVSKYPEKTAQYVTLTDANFKAEVLDSKQPVLVDFWASWCGPCRSMEPAIAGLASEFAGRAKVAKLNIDDQRALARQYQINAIPAFLIIQDGQVVDRVVGVTAKADLAAKINARLKTK